MELEIKYQSFFEVLFLSIAGQAREQEVCPSRPGVVGSDRMRDGLPPYVVGSHLDLGSRQ